MTEMRSADGEPRPQGPGRSEPDGRDAADQDVGRVVHKLNNLLLPILTLGTLIGDAAADEGIRRDAETIVRCAEEARLLLAELMRLQVAEG